MGESTGCDYCHRDLGANQWVIPPKIGEQRGRTFCSEECLEGHLRTDSPRMSDNLPVARCGDCLYWHHVGGSKVGSGHCRAHSIGPLSSTWPEVFPHDWCGEFIHRTLGKQWWDEAEGVGATIKCPPYRVWRFPTEEG